MGLIRKNKFFEACSWLKFNNLGHVLGMIWRFHASMTKGLELKFRKFWGLFSSFVEVTRKNS